MTKNHKETTKRTMRETINIACVMETVMHQRHRLNIQQLEGCKGYCYYTLVLVNSMVSLLRIIAITLCKFKLF